MVLKNPVFFIVGLVVSILLFILALFLAFRKHKIGSGIKIANTDLLYKDKRIKNSLITYYILRAVMMISILICVVVSFILLSRPYYIKKIHEEKKNRDIIICLDISSSVDELNLKLVRDLQDVVRGLSGERIGIVIFNTSSIVLSPLSDDYEYTISQLENIRTAIKTVSKSGVSSGKDYYYWQDFLYEGTLVGNAERGSSLIGDGLLGGLFAFPEDSKDRTKIIIFSTDNDANGEGYVNLTEAAEYCKKSGVTVYGIGTEVMYTKDRDEMRSAMQLTGGKFYLEEDSKAFHNIVEEIESKSASLVAGRTIIKEIESPEEYFKILVICFGIALVLTIVLRRINGISILISFVAIICMVLTYIFYVVPAHTYQLGPDLIQKKTSNYNVLFVVDDTISMLADDCGKVEGKKYGKERLTKVYEDCEIIIDELEGAKFSVISFNNNANILSPYNNNAEHTKNLIKSIYPLQEIYAQGSSLNKPLDAITASLKTANGKTAIFFLSDGENTSEEALATYSSLRNAFDDGAVIGYGTKKGGNMRVKSVYSDDIQEIVDYDVYPFELAVSKIDENNLKQIADDLGIDYINMDDSDKLKHVVNRIQGKLDLKIEEKEEIEDKEDKYIEIVENRGRFFIIPLIVSLIILAAYEAYKE